MTQDFDKELSTIEVAVVYLIALPLFALMLPFIIGRIAGDIASADSGE